jgi:hypothetical protein
MARSCLVIALLAGVGASACGQVASSTPDARPPAPDGSAGTPAPVMYKGTLDQTTPVTFGGSPYCSYTITLKQLELDLAIVPGSNQVASGSVEDLNVEAIVPPCPNGAIPAGIARYTFAPAAPASDSAALSFTGDAANDPVASLAVQLSSVGSAYQASLGFHRTDSPVAALNWSVVATISLMPE